MQAKFSRVDSTLDLKEVSNLALNGSIVSITDALEKVYLELDKVKFTEASSSPSFREAEDVSIQNGRLYSNRTYDRLLELINFCTDSRSKTIWRMSDGFRFSRTMLEFAVWTKQW